jgi:multiple sugar transport system permease protein
MKTSPLQVVRPKESAFAFRRPTATIARPTPNSRRLRLPFAGTYLMLLIIGILTALPLLFMLTTSLKTLPEVLADPPITFPHVMQWGNYEKAFTQFPFLRYLGNTVILAIGRMTGVLISSALVAWGFARFKSRFNGPLFLLCLATLMLPAQVTAIPVFSLFLKAGFYNTYVPLILPAWLATNAFFIFLLKQFFEAIPEDLLNAARLDGCSEWRIFWSIGVPLSKPILWTVAVFTFIGSWNDYFGPLIYLSDERRYPLSLGLTYFMSSTHDATFGTQWNLMMAVATVTMIPAAILFFVAQRSFVDNAVNAAIK